MRVFNDPLQKLLTSHGLNTHEIDGWLCPEVGSPRVAACLFNEFHDESTGRHRLQLDVRVEVSSGRWLIESFGGWGASSDEAIAWAFENFARNSLHVLLAAFYQRSNEQVEFRTWAIAGHPRQVILGPYGMVGTHAYEPQAPASLITLIETLLSQHQLDESPHWLRVYVSRSGDRDVFCEVLLDNETWEEAQTAVAELDWAQPPPAVFYSVRNFLTVAAVR
jgi:hypothetical protein